MKTDPKHTSDYIPVAHAVRRAGGITVLACPFGCGRPHFHGLASSGTVVAHCGPSPGQYRLEIVADVIELHPPPRRGRRGSR